jgi:hypothetical protein
MFFCFYQINKETSSFESLYPMNSINNPKILSLFMGGLILQLFNPILLANLVLTRLVNLFLFHYNNNISFIISGFCGWLGGHILFIILTKLVSFCIERNSPIDYTRLRRYIHRTFSLLLLSYCSFYLGRAPLLFLKRKNDDIGDKDDGSVVMARDEDDRSVTMARDEDDHSVVMTRDEDDSFVAMVRDEDDRSVAMARDKDVAMAIDENENEISMAMAIDENYSFAAMAIDPKKLKGLPKEEPLSWFKKPWPIMFFDHNRSYRPI